ncbi:MAG: phosphotransferase, partial [Thermodesulfobacteriota bacterium]
TGIILCEDLGDLLLHNAVTKESWSEEDIVSVYGQAVEMLAQMQVDGGRDFKQGWCWDSGRYDRTIMLDRESGYFSRACCRELLGLNIPDGLHEEFILLADLASSAPAGFFLHRDFQSRNIMVYKKQLRVIDFQGGRLGPLGYDLASLLNDPYVSLADPIKDRLIVRYLQALSNYMDVDGSLFMESYYWLSLQRNLQIIGAFSYLSNIKGKKFFRGFLQPAVLLLDKLLAKPLGGRFPVLRVLADSLPEKVAQAIS